MLTRKLQRQTANDALVHLGDVHHTWFLFVVLHVIFNLLRPRSRASGEK